MSYPNYSTVYPRARMMGSPIMGSRAVSAQLGSHANRIRRFQARSARRWGNWDVLTIPTALLWSADAYEAELEADAMDDLMDQEPDVVDPWS
jgi:hypothetical protein